MLSHETSAAVLVYDELEGFVVPAVLAVAVPVLVSALVEGDGGGVVEADYEGGGLDDLEGFFVLGGDSNKLCPRL